MLKKHPVMLPLC